MGLAASQARYLALTARKSDLEFQSQTINTRRIQLAYRTAEVARAYSEGMNNQQIMIQNNVDGEPVWEELSFQKLLDSGFVVIPAAGMTWSDIDNENPYNEINDNPDETDPSKLDIKQEVAYYISTLPNADMTEEDAKACLSEYNATDFSQLFVEFEKEVDGEKVKRYKFNPDGITTKLYEKLTDDAKKDFQGVEQGTVNLSVSSSYENNGNMGIQALLTSGRAQIVSKEFFNYLVTNFGYNPDNYALPGPVFAQAQTKFDQNNDHENMSGVKSIFDWRADEDGRFKSRNYTEDDAQVLANYEAATQEIQAQDKQLEVQEKNIETQHKAIETELESIQKVIQNNIEKTFKIFS